MSRIVCQPHLKEPWRDGVSRGSCRLAGARFGSFGRALGPLRALVAARRTVTAFVRSFVSCRGAAAAAKRLRGGGTFCDVVQAMELAALVEAFASALAEADARRPIWVSQ